MKHRDIWNQKRYLDYLFGEGKKFKDDYEMLAHWSRYLCVLICGWIQIAVYEIYSDLVQRKSSAEVQRFVLKKLKRLQSPMMNNIVSLTYEFSKEWGCALEKATNGELKTAVDGIVSNRNLIAHGESSDISYYRLKEYYEKAVKVIELLEQQC